MKPLETTAPRRMVKKIDDDQHDRKNGEQEKRDHDRPGGIIASRMDVVLRQIGARSVARALREERRCAS